MPVSELAERDTRAIKASIVGLAPLVVETLDGVTHATQLTPTEPNGAQGLKPPDPNSRIQSTKVRWPALEGLEAKIREHNTLQSAAHIACEALEVGGLS